VGGDAEEDGAEEAGEEEGGDEAGEDAECGQLDGASEDEPKDARRARVPSPDFVRQIVFDFAAAGKIAEETGETRQKRHGIYS
jgi:hypothetical protein